MTTTEAATTGAMGQRLLRKEDARLLTGEARFVDDLQIPGAVWLGMVRSPFAHARIGSIDTSAAAAMPGVRAVRWWASWSSPRSSWSSSWWSSIPTTTRPGWR
jgi:aerobic carbon-monoxide dehydrogenase large subunit